MLTDVLCDVVRRGGIACVVDLTAMEAYRRLIDWNMLARHVGVVHAFDTVGAGDYALTSFGRVFGKLLSMDAEQLFALESQGERIGTCSLHQDEVPPSGYPREVWQPDQAKEILRGAIPGPSEIRVASDAKEAAWGFEMGSRFFGDVKRRGRRDFGTVVGAVMEICQAPLAAQTNPRLKRLEGHGGRLWRYRVGDDRLVYDPDGARRVVRLIRFGPRGDVYKGLTL